jgi:mRNA interferase RelE/StbE
VKVTFSKKFEKQLDKINDPKIIRQLKGAVESIIDAEQLEEVPSLQKLKGYTNAYRVRSGQYRIGLIREIDGSILIAAVDVRGEFYKSFP